MMRFSACFAALAAALFLVGLCATPADAGRRMIVTATIASHAPEPFTTVAPRVTIEDQRGRPIAGARCTFSWRLPSRTVKAIKYTNARGIAVHARRIGGGLSGFRVSVTATCRWRGQVKTSRTWFVAVPVLPAVPKLVFVGDSLSAGYFALSEAQSFRGLVTARFPCTSALIGVYGLRSGDVDLSSITAEAGDVVIVEVGSNDAAAGVAPADFEARLRAIAEAARAGSATCRLVFLSVWQTAPQRAPYDARIAGVARDYGGHRIELSAIKDDPSCSGPAGQVTYVGQLSDAWHPNNAGHAAIAAAVGRVIARLMGQRP